MVGDEIRMAVRARSSLILGQVDDENVQLIVLREV